LKTYERKTETESDSSRSGFSPDITCGDSRGLGGDAASGHAFAKKVE